MQEITAIKAAVKPSETLFVVDSMTGQDAVTVASAFDDALGIDGMVLTNLTVIQETARRSPRELLPVSQ